MYGRSKAIRHPNKSTSAVHLGLNISQWPQKNVITCEAWTTWKNIISHVLIIYCLEKCHLTAKMFSDKCSERPVTFLVISISYKQDRQIFLGEVKSMKWARKFPGFITFNQWLSIHWATIRAGTILRIVGDMIAESKKHDHRRQH